MNVIGFSGFPYEIIKTGFLFFFSRVQRSLNSSWLTALNPINYKNVTVRCINAREDGKEESSEEDRDERDVCKVKVIVIGRLSSNCSMNGSLSCRAADIWELLNQQKNSPRVLIAVSNTVGIWIMKISITNFYLSGIQMSGIQMAVQYSDHTFEYQKGIQMVV